MLFLAKTGTGKEKWDGSKDVTYQFAGNLAAGSGCPVRAYRLRTLLRQTRWRLLNFEFVFGEFLRTRWVR